MYGPQNIAFKDDELSREIPAVVCGGGSVSVACIADVGNDGTPYSGIRLAPAPAGLAVGERYQRDVNRKVYEEGTFFMLLFDNPASVGVVIHNLENIKKHLTQKQEADVTA